MLPAPRHPLAPEAVPDPPPLATLLTGLLRSAGAQAVRAVRRGSGAVLAEAGLADGDDVPALVELARGADAMGRARGEWLEDLVITLGATVHVLRASDAAVLHVRLDPARGDVAAVRRGLAAPEVQRAVDAAAEAAGEDTATDDTGAGGPAAGLARPAALPRFGAAPGGSAPARLPRPAAAPAAADDGPPGGVTGPVASGPPAEGDGPGDHRDDSADRAAAAQRPDDQPAASAAPAGAEGGPHATGGPDVHLAGTGSVEPSGPAVDAAGPAGPLPVRDHGPADTPVPGTSGPAPATRRRDGLGVTGEPDGGSGPAAPEPSRGAVAGRQGSHLRGVGAGTGPGRPGAGGEPSAVDTGPQPRIPAAPGRPASHPAPAAARHPAAETRIGGRGGGPGGTGGGAGQPGPAPTGALPARAAREAAPEPAAEGRPVPGRAGPRSAGPGREAAPEPADGRPAGRGGGQGGGGAAAARPAPVPAEADSTEADPTGAASAEAASAEAASAEATVPSMRPVSLGARPAPVPHPPAGPARQPTPHQRRTPPPARQPAWPHAAALNPPERRPEPDPTPVPPSGLRPARPSAPLPLPRPAGGPAPGGQEPALVTVDGGSPVSRSGALAVLALPPVRDPVGELPRRRPAAPVAVADPPPAPFTPAVLRQAWTSDVTTMRRVLAGLHRMR